MTDEEFLGWLIALAVVVVAAVLLADPLRRLRRERKHDAHAQLCERCSKAARMMRLGAEGGDVLRTMCPVGKLHVLEVHLAEGKIDPEHAKRAEALYRAEAAAEEAARGESES